MEGYLCNTANHGRLHTERTNGKREYVWHKTGGCEEERMRSLSQPESTCDTSDQRLYRHIAQMKQAQRADSETNVSAKTASQSSCTRANASSFLSHAAHPKDTPETQPSSAVRMGPGDNRKRGVSVSP